MTLNPKFNNKDGSLTAYGFLCGYIQSKTYSTGKDEIRVELYHDSCYHVRKFDYREGKEFRVWESFDNLTDARKAYKNFHNEIKKEIRNG